MYLPFNNNTKRRIYHRNQWFILKALFVLAFLMYIVACQENDDVPPVITMNGDDTLFHVLNVPYVDPGATAVDETDGDLTGNLFVDNQVNEDRVGEYSVHYRVVDDSGNEAPEVSRTVIVFNEAFSYLGDYAASEKQIFPDSGMCSYAVSILQDSMVNNRILFTDFACNIQREVYADISDSFLIVPFQYIQDSLVELSLQGSGTINDSLAFIEYNRIDSLGSALWQATFNRVK